MLALGWLQAQHRGDENDFKIAEKCVALVEDDEIDKLKSSTTRILSSLRQTEQQCSLVLVQTIHPSSATKPMCALLEKTDDADQRMNVLIQTFMIQLTGIVRLSELLRLNDSNSEIRSLAPYEEYDSITDNHKQERAVCLAARLTALSDFSELNS